jgi:hypothetical protein
VDLSALGTDIERVVVSEEQIQNRLKELAIKLIRIMPDEI